MDNRGYRFISFTLTILVFSFLFMFLLSFMNVSNGIFSLELLDARAGSSQPSNDCEFEDDDDSDDDDDDERTLSQCPGNCALNLVVGEGCESISVSQIVCEDECTVIVPCPTNVVLTAVAEPGFIFDSWSPSPCTGDDAVLNIEPLTGSLTCVASCEQSETTDGFVDVSTGEDDGEGGYSILLDLPDEVVIVKEFGAVAQEVNGLQNVVVVINLPEGVTANSASVNGDEGACEIINDTQVECTIEELTEETVISLELSVPNLGGEILLIQVLVTTDSFPGETDEQFLNLTAGTATTSSSSSCSIASTGGSKTALLLFAFLPALILIRRLRRK